MSSLDGKCNCKHYYFNRFWYFFDSKPSIVFFSDIQRLLGNMPALCCCQVSIFNRLQCRTLLTVDVQNDGCNLVACLGDGLVAM